MPPFARFIGHVGSSRKSCTNANMAAAGDRVNDARRHVRSARTLADDDTPLAMAACHDAIRKAITAHMLANGLRPRGGEGAHRIALDYAMHELGALISDEDLAEANEIRHCSHAARHTLTMPG